jgi:allantoate deiminase
VRAGVAEIAARRRLDLRIRPIHEAPAVACAPRLLEALERACARLGFAAPRLASGAGHDAMAIAALAPVAMLFVRCRGGISHDPSEFAAPADIEAALAVLVDTIVLLAEEVA